MLMLVSQDEKKRLGSYNLLHWTDLRVSLSPSSITLETKSLRCVFWVNIIQTIGEYYPNQGAQYSIN